MKDPETREKPTQLEHMPQGTGIGSMPKKKRKWFWSHE